MGGMWAIYPCLPDLTNETDHNSCQIILYFLKTRTIKVRLRTKSVHALPD